MLHSLAARCLAVKKVAQVNRGKHTAGGYDEPSIDCVVCLRPTQVRSLYSQIVGRGTRIYPGKDHLLLLDFLWLAEEHNLIKPAHLVAGDEDEAKAIMDVLGGDGDLEEAKAAAETNRAEKLRERLERNQTRTSRSFDAMEFALSLMAEVLLNS